MLNKKINSINIYGGSLFGVLLATSISKYPGYNNNFKIKIFEKNDTLLRGWSSRNINEVNIDNGFHGIEIPRALKSSQLLEKLLGKDLLSIHSNYRMISINNKLIPFDASLSEWPKELSSGLEKISLKKYSSDKNINLRLQMDAILNHTYLGELIKFCYKRHSEKIEDSWHLFYPWFFPSEFSFDGDDEGTLFQEEVRKRKIIPSYLKPKNYVFESLILPVENALRNINIEINKDFDVDESFINKFVSHEKSNDINIWAASSFELLRIFKPEMVNNFLSNKRNMHLFLFMANKNQYENWLKNFPRTPSEILSLSSDVSGIGRISFPQYGLTNLNKIGEQKLILVEYYTKLDKIENFEIDSITNYLTSLFKFDVQIYGTSLGRVVYLNDSNQLLQADRILEESLNNSYLNIPYKYWGPINMAKCGISADKTANSLLQF